MVNTSIHYVAPAGLEFSIRAGWPWIYIHLPVLTFKSTRINSVYHYAHFKIIPLKKNLCIYLGSGDRQHVWRAEGNLWELILPFYCVRPGTKLRLSDSETGTHWAILLARGQPFKNTSRARNVLAFSARILANCERGSGVPSPCHKEHFLLPRSCILDFHLHSISQDVMTEPHSAARKPGKYSPSFLQKVTGLARSL